MSIGTDQRMVAVERSSTFFYSPMHLNGEDQQQMFSRLQMIFYYFTAFLA